MGGLGCPLLTYLAASGVGTLGIADHDKVELSNLNRQILFNYSDLNKSKVLKAKDSAKKTYKNIKIKKFKSRLTSKNIKSILRDPKLAELNISLYPSIKNIRVFISIWCKCLVMTTNSKMIISI